MLLALGGRIPLVDGPHITEYERRFAQVTETDYAISFASGRMALYVILEALGIGPGDEVILPAFTCVVVPNAILYRGAQPVYVDIESDTYNIDASQIETKITPQTKAIIAQHTFGLICDVDAISEIARRYGLVVVEDCAHALGASVRGRKAGSLGQVACFSTDHSKVISTSTGGMVTTSDSELAKKVLQLQAATPFLPPKRIQTILITFVLEYLLFHPRFYSIGSYLHGLAGGRLWRAYFLDELSLTKPTEYPYPCRLSNAQARIGISQLEMLADNLAWRRKLARMFEAQIGCYGHLLEENYDNHAFLRYTFLVENRTAWEKHFEDVLDMGVWFTSVAHGRDRDFDEIGYQIGSCPVAEEVARHCVNLPTHPRVEHPHILMGLLRRACQSEGKGLKRWWQSKPGSSKRPQHQHAAVS